MYYALFFWVQVILLKLGLLSSKVKANNYKQYWLGYVHMDMKWFFQQCWSLGIIYVSITTKKFILLAWKDIAIMYNQSFVYYAFYVKKLIIHIVSVLATVLLLSKYHGKYW